MRLKNIANDIIDNSTNWLYFTLIFLSYQFFSVSPGMDSDLLIVFKSPGIFPRCTKDFNLKQSIVSFLSNLCAYFSLAMFFNTLLNIV